MLDNTTDRATEVLALGANDLDGYIRAQIDAKNLSAIVHDLNVELLKGCPKAAEALQALGFVV